MSMPRGKKIEHGYATVAQDDGDNYRTIAEIMTQQGHSMNHASARNHILRAMRKFIEEYAEAHDLELSEDKIMEIARNPNFQSAISSLIQKTGLI